MIVFTMYHSGCENSIPKEIRIRIIATSKCVNNVLMKLHEGDGVPQLD